MYPLLYNSQILIKYITFQHASHYPNNFLLHFLPLLIYLPHLPNYTRMIEVSSIRLYSPIYFKKFTASKTNTDPHLLKDLQSQTLLKSKELSKSHIIDLYNGTKKTPET